MTKLQNYLIIFILTLSLGQLISLNLVFAKEMENLLKHKENSYEREMLDLLGLTENAKRLKRHPSLRNSASKFLLKVYNEIQKEEEDNYHASHLDHHQQFKRSLPSFRSVEDEDTSFVTKLDRWEIENCNDIITFASRYSHHDHVGITQQDSKIPLNFNVNDVPSELDLVHSVLRIYKDPHLATMLQPQYINAKQQITVTLYKRFYRKKEQVHDFKILNSLNTTLAYKGWLEFNVTNVLSHWLHYKSQNSKQHGHDLYLDVSLVAPEPPAISPSNIGMILFSQAENVDVSDLQPFIIGYFNGPELLAKVQTLRFKQELVRHKRQLQQNQRRAPPQMANEVLMKPCERLNFTLEFKDLELHNTIIAPKKFDAFFCGGQCNFPLGSKMNATNHAIVQTLMHLKKPHLPKPCCVPTVLGSISILYYLNEDSVNLKKIPQSVAMECGCH